MHREPSDHVPGARRLPQREHHGDDAAARDMRDELEAHLALRRDALVAAGMDADAALLEARRRFGDFEATQAQLVALAQDRDRRTTHRDRLATLVGDWTLALRRVRRAPASFALPVVTIAIAVALCCTVFALVDGVLLKPLAFPRSEELLAIQGADSLGAPIVTVSSDNWHDWREQSRTLSAVAIYQPLRVSVVANGDASTRAAVVAPADVFDVMQPQFLWGRRYTTDDADSDAGAVVVSERLWHDLFGDRTPSAATVTIGGTPRTIVGVVRQAHVYPEWTEVWLPYRHRQIGGAARNNINWLALGRMRAGVSVESAQRDLSAVAARIRAAETVPLNSPGVRVLPLIDIVVGDFSSFLRLLLVSVGAVLLLACTNLAAANLSRAAGRARDFAVQLAIGASRARLAGQLLVEHATVALMGAALGTSRCGGGHPPHRLGGSRTASTVRRALRWSHRPRRGRPDDLHRTADCGGSDRVHPSHGTRARALRRRTRRQSKRTRSPGALVRRHAGRARRVARSMGGFVRGEHAGAPRPAARLRSPWLVHRRGPPQYATLSAGGAANGLLECIE